ncbi:MAG TPA: APC family permease, partial [Terriglobales bacterium]|nr:APC family permease [Terriglobales bacterium]
MLEQDTQTRQRELRKELGLRNLVFSQILNIVGLFWIGAAAKLGPANVSFWLCGVALFYLPSAVVVIYLNRAHTLEGGLYEWSRLGFNELVGFLVAWNLWLNAVAILSYGGIQATVMLSYALGPRAAWIVDSRWVMGGVTLLILGSLIAIAFIGMSLGKKVQDFGGAVMVIVFVALIALPWRNHWIGRPTQHAPFTLALPVISLFSLNVLGKMSFGAFGGFDGMAIFAGECRDATRAIGRSIIIATPIIVLMFVLGTSSVVALVPKDKIDLISPISQALTMGTRPTDAGASLIPLAILAMLLAFIAQMALSFAITTRLPLVAGWDHLLPEWFGRLHPRRKTPTNAILFVGTVAFALAIAGVAGAGQQEAFQLLQNASGIFYALSYLVMFALPLFGRQRQVLKPALWLQAAAVSGFIMTAMYLVLALFPIIDVPRPLVFTAKIGGFVLACQLGAAALFYSYRRR